MDREQQRLRPYLVRYRPPLASVSSSSFSSRPTPSFSPGRGRGRIDKQGGWQGCNVHDSICRNKIKTALSLSLSLRFFLLPSTFHLPSQIVEYIGEFITNASYLLSLYRSREEKKKRVQHLFRFGKLNNRADSIFAREVEEGRGIGRSTLSPFSTRPLSLSLFLSPSLVPGLPLKKEGWLADNELMYDPVTSPTRQPPSPALE